MNDPFDSFSQNGEDVVLHRALGHIASGRYIDVGANDPVKDSVSMAFYERGWSGLTIEPDPSFAQAQREIRPRDTVIEAAAGSTEGDTLTLHVVEGTGLSTVVDSIAGDLVDSGRAMHDHQVSSRRLDQILEDAGWEGRDIHFMSVDTEGSERQVLEGIDLRRWRPWILVIEATAPNSTESTRDQWEQLVLDADYRFCLFDGLSCFFVAEEHDDALRPALSYPACILDNYTTWNFRQVIEKQHEMLPLIDEVVLWRTQTLTRWATAVSNEMMLADLRAETAELRGQRQHLLNEVERRLDEVKHLQLRIDNLLGSTSWRLSRPIRATSGLLSAARRRR